MAITLEGLQSAIVAIGEDIKTFVSEKPLTSAGIATGVVGASTLGVVAATKSSKKRKKKTSKGRSRDRKFISKQKHEQAYIRRKKRKGKKITRKRYKTKSSKRKTKKKVGKVYYTKRGQPYKILASGKAKFIKK